MDIYYIIYIIIYINNIIYIIYIIPIYPTFLPTLTLIYPNLYTYLPPYIGVVWLSLTREEKGRLGRFFYFFKKIEKSKPP